MALSYEEKRNVVKNVLKCLNWALISIFAIVIVLIITYNLFNVITKSTNGESKTNDFGFINNCYFVPVTTDAWSEVYPKFSFLIVKDEGINYDYLMIGESVDATNDERQLREARLNATYVIRIEEAGEVSYTLGKIEPGEGRTQEGVAFSNGVYATYGQILGSVEFVVPCVAMLGNEVFILITLFLLVLFIGFLIIFSFTDLGHDMLFDREVRKQMKKDKTFGYVSRRSKKVEVLKTEEDIVQEMLEKIISDTGDSNKDKNIPLSNVLNAMKVINAQEFTSKEKIFVYLASLNLLNAYVKREDAIDILKKKYFFKKYVQFLANYVQEKNNEEVKIFTDGQTILFECLGMQFSFHFVKINDMIVKKKWAGIRLQPYANQIFNLFFEKEFLGFSFPEFAGTMKKYEQQILKEIKKRS